jgi:hypothetical protein
VARPEIFKNAENRVRHVNDGTHRLRRKPVYSIAGIQRELLAIDTENHPRFLQVLITKLPSTSFKILREPSRPCCVNATSAHTLAILSAPN